MKKIITFIWILDLILTACIIVPVALLTESWMWSIIAFCALVLVKVAVLGGIIAKLIKGC